jgi:hydroxymethylbilane synthase
MERPLRRLRIILAKLRVGTRGSALAIKQTEIVVNTLLKSDPSTEFELVKINTRGDMEKRPLFTMDEKGIFQKEVV